jgi:hypothetical protein
MAPTALVALLLAAASPTPLPGSPVTPALHLSVGTGTCDRASPAGQPDQGTNPCLLVIGIAATARYRMLEAGVSYEGRQLVDLLSLFSFRPPTATVVGGTLGLVAGDLERWRFSAAGELGWRRYTHFVGDGPSSWAGDADTVYAGLVGRAATGMRNPGGRTDRFEVTLAWRHDLHLATDTVDGTLWQVGGWSITMGFGVVADW